MEKKVNNYAFANQLDAFKVKVIDPQSKKVDGAFKIMSDLHYPWKDEEQKQLAQARLDSYKAWLDFYKLHYNEGLKLTTQHEQLVDQISKWYDNWYNNISNKGRQEPEMMEMQADMLQEIFIEMYKILQPLNLDIKQPNALNL